MSYTISCEDTHLVISDTGGTVESFTVGGKNVFYPYHENEKGRKRGGMPICAPWFGSSVFGREKHGILRMLKMKLGRQMDDSLSLGSFHFHAGVGLYPWHIEYRLNYTVKRRAFSVCMNVMRMKDGVSGGAPLNVGFHPYFAGDAKKFLVKDLQNKYDASFSDIAKSELLKHEFLEIQNEDRDMEMKLSGMFYNEEPHVYFWSDEPNKYVCIEPVLYDSKLFNTDKGFFLEEGEAIEIKMQISVEKENEVEL